MRRPEGGTMHRTAVKKVVLEGVLDANDALAQANRQRFDAAGNFVVNMMSSPGAGKTALLEHTLDRTLGQLRIGGPARDVPPPAAPRRRGQGRGAGAPPRPDAREAQDRGPRGRRADDARRRQAGAVSHPNSPG